MKKQKQKHVLQNPRLVRTDCFEFASTYWSTSTGWCFKVVVNSRIVVIHIHIPMPIPIRIHVSAAALSAGSESLS